MLKVKICQYLKPCHHHSILKDTEISFKYIHSSTKTLLILYPLTLSSRTCIAISKRRMCNKMFFRYSFQKDIMSMYLKESQVYYKYVHAENMIRSFTFST